MKKNSTTGAGQKPRPKLKWQKGAYDRYAEFKFILPYQFLLLCRLMDITPEEVIRDFTEKLSSGSCDHLVNYFIAQGYGQHYYTEDDLRQIFKEMNAMGLLFPKNGKQKLVDMYVSWRDKHHGYWFKKWFQKYRRPK